MATSPLFGWEEPDDTDLVKDGAAAIRTLGNAIDTSMGDLLGGTTGQVLSKNSNTNMDFTWVAQDDSNAIQNAIVDAKGDLIAASAADTPARLAVGNNGETLVADSSTSTGLRWQGSQAAGKNTIINGGMDFFQRSTFSAGANGYALDRWFMEAGGGTTTVTQQTTGAPSGSRYVMRVACAQTGAYANTFQFIETANALNLAGKTVTLSALVRRNASYSANLTLKIEKNAAVDAGYATASWVSVADATITNANIPTGTTAADWARITVTAAIPNDGTANSLRISFSENATQTNGAYKEYAQVQLEVGSVPTQFTRAGGTIQGELAACQRYYIRLGSSNYTALGYGVQYSTTLARMTVSLPVALRTTPSAAMGGTIIFHQNGSPTNITSLNSVFGWAGSTLFQDINVNGTAGQSGGFYTNNATTNYYELSAEL